MATPNDIAKLAELLRTLQSTQNQERQQAETLYQQTKAGAPDSLIIGLLAIIKTETIDESTRRQAAILLRQLVQKGNDKDFVFVRLSPQQKQEVANELLARFEAESNTKVQKAIGGIIARLAEAAYDREDQRGWFAPGQCGWPALLPMVLRMADSSAANPRIASCEPAIRLLKDLIQGVKDEIVQAQQHVGSILQNALAHANMPIRIAAFVLVCEMVATLEKRAWAPLMGTVSTLNQIMQQLAQTNMQDDLQECLQNYVEVAMSEPDFFKQQLTACMEPANFFKSLVKARDGMENGIRNLALEWLVVYTEQKPKWLAKSLRNFADIVLECCMEMMLEVEEDEAAIKHWMGRMDDEEGEEDMDELHHSGAEAIDRVVEAMSMETVSSFLFQKIGVYTSQDAWQAKHAALVAIKQTIEYVEDTNHINEMAKLLFAHTNHPHPRVRHAALHAIGQMANDQAPHFQDSSHQVVMPMLLQKMDDQVDRVAAMAMSAFVSFGEELENALMIQYAHEFMAILVRRLQSTTHRMVKEESITSIAVIAGVIEKDFSKYYDGIMPMLKTLVLQAKDVKESRLRGKAFECMSLLGIAVGKEKFLPDAREALEEMLKTPLEADDMQREYIKEASERICKCLQKDFAPFLPHLLPSIFKSMNLEDGEAAAKPKVGTEDDEDEYVDVSTGTGKIMKVHSTKFEELQHSVQLLKTICIEMEGAFFDCVPQTAQALLPLLSVTDETSMLCDEARGNAFQTWAALIKCARVGAKERGQPNSIANELLRTFMQRTFARMQQDSDPDTLSDAADGLAECLKALKEEGNPTPQSVLNSQELLQLVQQLFKLIDDSFLRSIELDKAKKQDAATAPAELQGDEDDEEDNAEESEEQCRRNLEDAVGAAMCAAPVEFVQCLPECGRRLEQWLSQSKQNKALALYLACDLLENLREQSGPLWPTFMPAVFAALGDKNAEVRIPAAYAISLASPLAMFAEGAPEAFKLVAQLVSGPAPKKRDEQGKVALDNAVSALVMLAKEKPQQCPPEIPAWQLAISKLPLQEDEEEAKKIHKLVVDLVLEQHAGLLGPNGAHIPKILSALAEVYNQENLCTKETNANIVRIFQQLPRDNIAKYASEFTEKQQKKIEKMLTTQ